MGNAIAFALAALQAIQQLAEAGTTLWQVISDTSTALQAMQAEKRDPSPEEWDALNTQIKAALDELNG